MIEYSNHTQIDFEDVWNVEKEYLEPSTISSVEQVMEWDNKNKDIHIFVRDLNFNKIVGEITLLPLSKKQFDDFMLNKIEDVEFKAHNLLKYEENGLYYLLFSVIAIAKEYRNDSRVLSCLLKGMNVKINTLLQKNIRFENMCAEGQTKDGQKFIENFLNLEEKNTTENGYKLYSFNNSKDFAEWLKKFPKYIQKYDKESSKKEKIEFK